MQLQTIIGISKFKRHDAKGEILNFSTTTHGVNIKTFEKLQELGYIDNLQKEFYKNRSIPIESLAFGNWKNLFQKKDFYKINFNRTDKVVDLEDEKLKKTFGLVFNSKKGIISKNGYHFRQKDTGELEIDYKAKEIPMDNSDSAKEKRGELQRRIQKGAPSLTEQKANANRLINNKSRQQPNTIENNREEKE